MGAVKHAVAPQSAAAVGMQRLPVMPVQRVPVQAMPAHPTPQRLMLGAVEDMLAVVVVVDTRAADTSNRRLRSQPALCTKGGGANQLRRSCV